MKGALSLSRMDARDFGEPLVTLLVIMDPLGGAPIFLSVEGLME